MERPREVALFVDFENIRYSVLNTYHRELSGSMLMEIGRRYGLVTLARSYADFEEHPERVQRDLQVSGISAVNVASLQVGERPKGGADMEMLMDIFETLLDRPFLGTYILMTGDRRFIRMVTMIRNRYGKEVVIAGVRGSVSNDLIEAAGGSFEPLEFEPVADDERRDAFVRFVDRLERSKPFITFKYVSAAMTTSTEFPGLAEDEAREFVAQAIQEGLLLKQQRPDGYRVLHLNRERPEVGEILGAGRGSNGAREHEDGDFEDEGYLEEDEEFEDDFEEEEEEEEEEDDDDEEFEDDFEDEDGDEFEEEEDDDEEAAAGEGLADRDASSTQAESPVLGPEADDRRWNR
jgi:uncharacterized LabA/DUF88 family protein